MSLLFVMYTYYLAISRVGVAPAILLQNTRPVLVMLYTVAVLHERAPRFAPAATALALAGCALVVRAYDPSLLQLDLAGVVAGLASAAFAAINLLAGRTVQVRLGIMPALAIGLTIAAALSLLVYSPSVTLALAGQPDLLAGGIAVGIFGTLIPFGLTLRSVHYISPTETAILGGLEAVVGGIVAAVWLGDLLEVAQVFGGALILASVVGLAVGEREDVPSL